MFRVIKLGASCKQNTPVAQLNSPGACGTFSSPGLAEFALAYRGRGNFQTSCGMSAKRVSPPLIRDAHCSDKNCSATNFLHNYIEHDDPARLNPLIAFAQLLNNYARG